MAAMALVLSCTRRIRRTSASSRSGTPSALRALRCRDCAGCAGCVIASSSASPAPSARCVVSRASCFTTSAFTRSGRSSTMQPRVVCAAVSRKSRMKRRALHHVAADRRLVVDALGGELDDRARLDVAPRVDVMADAGRHRAERLAPVVPVGVDQRRSAASCASARRSAGPCSTCSGVSASSGLGVRRRRGGRCDTRRSGRPARSAPQPRFATADRRCSSGRRWWRRR